MEMTQNPMEKSARIRTNSVADAYDGAFQVVNGLEEGT
jgi:hypothetical protein